MNFAFSEEQEAFRETLRRFLEARSPTAEVFRLMETPEGYDPAVWKPMAEELGLQGLIVPEAYGGQGFGHLELAIALEEMGRVLLCAPYFSTVCLAASALLEAGGEAERRAWLPGIAAGDTLATLAWVEPGGGWDLAEVALEYARDGDAARLRGAKAWVPDGATAELLLVVARQPGSRGPEGLSLLAMRGDAPGLRATPVDGLDATRKLAHLELSDVRAQIVGDEGAAGPALARTLDRACVALAAESAGGAARCLESAAAYARQRVQFGRPIGSFQAIKHKCAEVLLEVESARSAAYWASWVAAEHAEELRVAAAVAKSFCCEAYLRAAAENLHIHGGMGFTWEADPHLYLKRAKSNEVLLGDPRHHRARLADALGF